MDPTLVKLKADIRTHKRKVEAFWADLMTKHCPCTDDFVEQFDGELRQLAHKLLDRALEVGDRATADYAGDILEQWMP